jgi:hypothetical protein
MHGQPVPLLLCACVASCSQSSQTQTHLHMRAHTHCRRAGLEYEKETQTLKCPFRSLSLKKVKRRDTKSDEAVTEEKFALVLYTWLAVGDVAGPQPVFALSHPLVVIVHGNQHAKAMATIVWDNYFADRVCMHTHAHTLVLGWGRRAGGVGLSQALRGTEARDRPYDATLVAADSPLSLFV